MKRASVLHSIMAKETFAINDVCMIGLISILNMDLITSAEYTSLKELVAIVHGTSIEIGEVMTIMIITSSMIYLANADQLQNNNTMMRALLVHNKWSTR